MRHLHPILAVHVEIKGTADHGDEQHGLTQPPHLLHIDGQELRQQQPRVTKFPTRALFYLLLGLLLGLFMKGSYLGLFMKGSYLGLFPRAAARFAHIDGQELWPRISTALT